MNPTKVAAPIMIAAGINSLHAVREEGAGSVFKVIAANAALLGGIIAVGQFVNWSIAQALSYLYLVSVILSSRQSTVDAITWVSDLVEGL